MRWIVVALAGCWPIHAQALDLNRLELHSVRAESVTYKGRRAVRVTDDDLAGGDDVSRIAIVRETSFLDGTIEVALTGNTALNAAPNLRGFVGLAFRVARDGAQYECIYLRPKNGRSEEQVHGS